MFVTREAAVEDLAKRNAERDRIQANLDDLDGSFGKRLLTGAKLTGITAMQWESAAADLAFLWEAFASYLDVVQRAADLLDGRRRTNSQVLTELTSLLTGPSVVLAGRDVPLARRQLTGSSRPEDRVTLDLAVEQMTAAFSRVNEVINAAEKVWTELSARLNEISEIFGTTAQQTIDLGDEALRGKAAAVETEKRRMRELLSSDPLSLWQGEQVAVSSLEQLLQRARAVAGQTAELTRLRADADRRLADVADQVAAARACEQDARAQFMQAAQKIAADQLPTLPAGTDDLTARLAELDSLRAANRLQRLATDIAAIEKDAAAAALRWQEAEVAARAVLEHRSELRGLLDAYQAKAGRLGAAEDPEASRRLQVARDLLWSAPCDLDAAAEAVRSYQSAVLAIQRGKS